MTQSTSNLLAELASSINPLTGKLAAGVTAYANVAELPTDNNTIGSMAFVTESNKLYLWNGSSWFNIAIVNQAPTAITGNEPSYALAIDGTPTVVTLSSTDPEGFPLTWSATTSGDTAVGTLTQADNVFTITPSTDEADVGTLSITFSVTDGTNTETSVSSFTLAFVRPNNASFDATFDATMYVTSSLFDVSLGDNVTIEAFVRPTLHASDQSGGDRVTILGTSNNGQAYGNGFGISYVRVGDFIEFKAGMGSGSISGAARLDLQSSESFVPDTWYHVAAAFDGTTVRLFVDGIMVASGNPNGEPTSSSSLHINGSYDSRAPLPTETGICKIWNARWTRSCLYTSNFPRPAQELVENIPNCVLLTCATNTLEDLSPQNHTVTMRSGSFAFSSDYPFA